MIDEDEAQGVVSQWLASTSPSKDIEDEVVVWKVEEHSRAWIVQVATRRWVRTRNFSDQLVGRCPLVVEKSTGGLHEYGSGPDGYREFSAWLED